MMITIALDLGGTIIKSGLFKNGGLLAETETGSVAARGFKASLVLMDSVIDGLLKDTNTHRHEISGIGLCFPGLVDSVNQKIISTNQKYNDGPDTDLVAWARESWGCPVFIENDARMALIGEWQCGIGKGYDNLVLVTLGTGVGTSVLMEGKLVKGKHFQAGNLGGHLIVNHRGAQCTCGAFGCVEAESSTWRLPSLIKGNPGFAHSSIRHEKVLDFAALFRHALNGDSLSLEVLEHTLSVWSAGIISLIHAFDPEKVILAGGIMKSAGYFLPKLQERVNKYAWTPWGKVQLLKATYQNAAALYGADHLVRTSLQSLKETRSIS